MNYQLLAISEEELERLRVELGAVTDRFAGKGEDGAELDTVEFTRKVDCCEDLSGSPQAEGISEGFVSSQVDLLFEHPDMAEVRLRISTLHGSIWFRNAVPESVIDHVFEVFHRVKGL